jgi:hypothetical protein
MFDIGAVRSSLNSECAGQGAAVASNYDPYGSVTSARVFAPLNQGARL